ncbi:hypothetical protein ACFSLT_26880 [Novosphingobium resinovorum]
MQQHRRITGKILYTSRKPGREGQERGREDFVFTVHSDGKRSMRAICEIDERHPPCFATSRIRSTRTTCRWTASCA